MFDYETDPNENASGAEVYFGKGGNSFGGIFTGEKGKIEVNRNRFASNPSEIAAELLKGKPLRTGIAPHHDDFVASSSSWKYYVNTACA